MSEESEYGSRRKMERRNENVSMTLEKLGMSKDKFYSSLDNADDCLYMMGRLIGIDVDIKTNPLYIHAEEKYQKFVLDLESHDNDVSRFKELYDQLINIAENKRKKQTA